MSDWLKEKRHTTSRRPARESSTSWLWQFISAYMD